MTTQIIAILCMLPGLFGLIIPILPGVPYMLLVAAAYLWIDGATHLTWPEFALLAAFAVASLIVDYVSGALGARMGGGSKRSALYGLVGSLIGTAITPVIGTVLGMFAGVLLGELQGGKTPQVATRAGVGGILGYIAGIAVNGCIAVIFLITFFLQTMH